MEKAMISGLDDIVVAETVLSDIDGQSGRLIIRGQLLDELVEHATYETVLAALWEGFFKESPRADEIPAMLAAARQRAFDHLAAADVQLIECSTIDAV